MTVLNFEEQYMYALSQSILKINRLLSGYGVAIDPQNSFASAKDASRLSLRASIVDKKTFDEITSDEIIIDISPSVAARNLEKLFPLIEENDNAHEILESLPANEYKYWNSKKRYEKPNFDESDILDMREIFGSRITATPHLYSINSDETDIEEVVKNIINATPTLKKKVNNEMDRI